jgi:hypothetical protein
MSGLSFAQSMKHSDWNSSVKNGYVEAYTFNESNSAFGVLCMEKCVYYVDMKIKCTDGDKYSALMATTTGASSVKLNCLVLKDRFVNIIEPFDDVTEHIKDSENIGFAIALKSGKFNVSRFSLNGSIPAISRVVTEAVKQKDQKDTGYRNQQL